MATNSEQEEQRRIANPAYPLICCAEQTYTASAIIDLYELPQYERKRFVKLFLEALVNAPKHLWHPILGVIDEAHVFATEKGQSEAMEAIIDLATRRRKRGYCALLNATIN